MNVYPSPAHQPLSGPEVSTGGLLEVDSMMGWFTVCVHVPLVNFLICLPALSFFYVSPLCLPLLLPPATKLQAQKDIEVKAASDGPRGIEAIAAFR